MDILSIISLGIDIAALIATIGVSFAIYWLQSRHEKEIRELEQKHKEDQFIEKAEQFLFDNEEERDYLPLCIIAAYLHRHEKHYRKIYSNFCRCTVQMQNQILIQAGYTKEIIFKDNWLDSCLDKLNEDIKKYNLGRDILYDNAKYLHRGYIKYGDNLWDDVDEPVFKEICEKKIVY